VPFRRSRAHSAAAKRASFYIIIYHQVMMLCVKTLALLICFTSIYSFPAQSKSHPKLIVVVIVDQMRADYLERFSPYETGGFHRFASEGADFLNANYQHSPTETCVGHAVLLSGRNPAHTGVVANEWYERATRKMMYCVEDPAFPLIGEAGLGASPKNFLGDGLGDWLQSAFPASRVYSISLKDRAAILMAGRHPQGVFWYAHQDGRFITSRYYAAQLPAWVEQFNQRHTADSYAGKRWTALLESTSPAYHTNQVEAQFPHVMPDHVGQELYDAVYGSPFGDEVLEEFAETTIAANQLGAKDTPDLLAISFSSNDAVGHTYGPNSPEIADEQIRLDRTLGRLMRFVNERLGRENVLWALSADHGSEPTPEAERTLFGNTAAQRLPFSDAVKSVEIQLNQIFHISGDMHWFSAQVDTMLYFDRAALAKHRITLQSARRALASQVRNVPGIAGFYDPSQLPASGWMPTYIRNSNYSARSGDVYYLTKQWTYFSSRPTGTSHGDPWPYDTHVPFVLLGWHILPHRVLENVHVVDLAPTLADIVGIYGPQSHTLDGQSRARLIR